jgi:TatD DNase family protein
VGCHPHHAEECGKAEVDQLAQLASHPKVVAWGEIGLDFYRKAAAPESQLESFQRQLEAADELELPVVIHNREAHRDVLATLRGTGRRDRAGVIHCFSGTPELALEFIGLGYLISIAGTVTYPQALQVKDVAAAIPLDGLVLETDAPFLSPVPKRGKRNEPGFLSFTAHEVARLRNMDWEELARATTRNAVNLFSLPEMP